MLRRLMQTIRERDLIHRGRHVVAACSGGADSIALLHGLWFLSLRLDFRLTAAHLHHGLRGAAADADERFVVDVCARRGIPLVCGKASVRERQRLHGGSLEMAAREARHDFFLRVLHDTGADAVALAHHRDDQAETVLMRLLSGSGPEGLGGMDYRAAPRPGLPVIRPLLDVSRSAITAFLQRHRLPWREDESNRDSSMLRNRIRNRLMPEIVAIGFPGAAAVLARFADMMREEARLAARQTARLAVPAAPEPLPLKVLHRQPVAGQRRVVRAWLKGGVVPPRDQDFELTERVRRLASGRDKAPIPLGPGCTIMRKQDCLAVTAPTVSGTTPELLRPVRLAVPGTTAVPGTSWRIVVSKARGYEKTPMNFGAVPSEAYVRRGPGKPPVWVVRGRRAGDRMAPLGMQGSVSLKELMINHKVGRERRERIPVLVCGGDILWVAGYRVARSCAVEGADAPSWRIRIEQTPA